MEVDRALARGVEATEWVPLALVQMVEPMAKASWAEEVVPRP